VRRSFGDGFELDDDAARVHLDELHRFLSAEAYWRRAGRARPSSGSFARRAGWSGSIGTWILHTADAYGLYEKIGFGRRANG
jgi:hypothetical protein